MLGPQVKDALGKTVPLQQLMSFLIRTPKASTDSVVPKSEW